LGATNSSRGLVTDTIPFSSVDGPGNRFVVFMQGCNFNCIACHNPYTINVCNDCGECVHVCTTGSLTFGPLGQVKWNEATCAGTDACTAVCRWDSTPKARELDVSDVLAEIRRAAPFLSGITVSGGEATQQPHFVHALFSAIKDDPRLAKLSCFVDSNGAADRDTWDSLLPVMDGAMIDLKCIDPDVHLDMTGQPNDQVLDSIRYLHSLDCLYEVRLLMLPGINDTPAMLADTATWLASIDRQIRVKVIGFRPHGVRPSELPLTQPTADQMARYVEVLHNAGITEVCSV
jgi:pyruvate formate lyase activating enzyme